MRRFAAWLPSFPQAPFLQLVQPSLARFWQQAQAWPVRWFARTRSPSAAGRPGRSRPRGRILSSWEHLGLKTGATSRCHAEPRMNEAALAVFSGSRYFGATMACSVVTRCRHARMGAFRSPCQGDKGMTIQAKLLGAVAVAALCAPAVTSPAQALTTHERSAKHQPAKAAGTRA